MVMKGYKAFDQDMVEIRGNGLQFELGISYSSEWDEFSYESGFHFCKDMECLCVACDIDESRIFEIEADGEIIEYDENRYAAEKIRLVRELTNEEIRDYFDQNQQRFIKSRDSYIRMAAAEQGYGLDVLLYDEDSIVRQAVAEQGFRLDILLHDEDFVVRKTVAKKGYGLDILVHDEEWQVRNAVAMKGHGLDNLVHDENWEVRVAVAKQGCGLGILIHDKELVVRLAAMKRK